MRVKHVGMRLSRCLTWSVLLLVISWAPNALAQTSPEEAETDPATPPPDGQSETEPAAEESTDTATDEAGEATTAEAVPEEVPPTPPEPAPRAELPRERASVVSSAREAAPPADSVLSSDRIHAPLVEYRTAWGRGVGFLVGDKRTVVTLGSLRDRFRRISVKIAGSDGPEVRVTSVELSTSEETPFVVLHLESDLDGTPLELSDSRPGVGDRVYLIHRRGPMTPGRTVPSALEAGEAVITAASASTVTVGTARSQLWQGSPLFDAAGRVVAFVGSETHALRAEQIFAEENRRTGRSLISPLFGLRVGTEFGGFLNDPFVFDIELGLALWDQLGIVFRLGIAFGQEVLVSVPATADHEQGIVEGDHRTIGLGLELKYRLLLTRSSMPLYIDIVAGVQYVNAIVETRGLALYSTVPGCDPYGGSAGDDCNLTVGEPPGRDSTHGVGPVFGFDIRVGVFTMGYRFLGEAMSLRLPDTHRLTFGVTYR